MPKLAIYVPKKDMREIEKWRHSINFSRVFMAALSHEIRRRSRTPQAAQDKISAAADFYRSQLAEDCEPLVDFGYRLGTEHVVNCRLTAGTIGKLAALRDAEMLDEKQTKLVQQALSDDQGEVDKFCDDHGFEKRACPTRHLAVHKGYVTGVADAWQEVCKHMNSTPADVPSS
jgi:hypothetical protein